MLDDTLGRDSRVLDAEVNRSHSNLSNLEKNCNQIFVKGPALTKDFFDKIQNDVVPQKTELFGYQMNTRRLFLLTGLILLFTFSTLGTLAMWFTDLYEKRINSMMVLSEESSIYDMWKAPSVRPYAKIYIFNYTNVDDFERGVADKLKVEEVGPYVYFEEMERVNIRFNKVDGTVSYQEKRSYRFSPELSNGSEDDLIVVPNLPMLAGAAVAKYEFNFLMRMSYSGLLKTLSERPFKTLRAHKFVNGYEDDLYDLAKNYLKFNDMRVFDHFGLLVWKAGTQPDVFTMNTGLHDFQKLGQIEKFNGHTHFNLWSTESCNSVQSSDGLIYPMHLVQNKKDLSFFVPQLCRKISMQFREETSILEKVPVFRYKFPLDVYDCAHNPNSKCYCTKDSGSCPPKGFFNSTLCSFGAPIFYSQPHLYGVDPEIQNGVDGMRKDIVVNDTYLDVHPKYGILLGGKLKVQVNVQIVKSFGISELSSYPDGLMLPTVWLESGLESKDFPEKLIKMVYQITFTIRNLELGLKYGCLLCSMVTLTSILLVLKKQRSSRSRGNSYIEGFDIE